MNKIIPIFIVFFLVVGSYGAISSSISVKENILSEKVFFSVPKIVDKKEFIFIDLPESTISTWETGKPMLPVVTKVYTLPFGSQVEDIKVTYSGYIEKETIKPVRPAPTSYVKSVYGINKINEPENEVSYADIDIYPKQPFSYRIGAGSNGNKHLNYLIIYLYPARYHPNKNLIRCFESAKIDVTFKPPENPVNFPDEYDLLIITPQQFETALQPLVDHKNGLDPPIRTIMTTLEEIPSGVGIDEQEDIKYYIKSAIETWGIDYVILVGAGVEGQEIFPVRYAWIPSTPYEDKFPSVLYYADIYNSTGGFSTWDYDGDGKYAEYPYDNNAVDLYPDVCLGLLPCNNIAEVNTIVEKIIDYKVHNKITKKILQVGGDSFTTDPEEIYEGEFANAEVLTKLPGYTSIKLWASEEKVTKYNIAKGIKNSVDFVDFSGHGSPEAWGTHPPLDEETWVPVKTIISPNRYFLYIDFDLYNINNEKKLPVFLFNACSNNKYTKTDQCMGWKVLSKVGGGGIATFAASGIGYGMGGSDETSRRQGWIEVHVFQELYNIKILGEVWKKVLSDYVTTFSSLGWGRIDQKTVIETTLIGDPTVVAEDGDDPRSLPSERPFLKIIGRILELFPRLAKIIEMIFKNIS
jgi:hypothetical protein